MAGVLVGRSGESQSILYGHGGKASPVDGLQPGNPCNSFSYKDRIDGWRVCWQGGWDKGKVFYMVMVERYMVMVERHRQ